MSAKQLAAILFAASAALHAQQPQSVQKPAPQPTDRVVKISVVVAPKGGDPVGGLQQPDFTVYDNGVVRNIASFKAASSQRDRTEVILLMDAVNARFTTMAYEQQQLQTYLRSNDGRLLNPTTIAVLTDKGIQIEPAFTQDGNVLSKSLDSYSSGLREIRRSAGFWGADERLQISLNAINQLATLESKRPGHKILVWISPGWPLLSGPEVELDGKQQEQIFGEIVRYSTQLRQANVTLYNVNPLGPGENLIREDYYREFTKAVTKRQQVQLGDLGLQVLAVQSGGLVLSGSSDISGMLKKCLADTLNWYEITFDAAPAEQANEYHRIEIKVDKPDLTIRTRDGYYAQP